VLETPKGGDNILFGMGLFTGRVNPRASALLWRSGADSQVTDVKIMGGGGTPTMDGKSLGAAQARSGDPVADGRWDAQYPSIWVTDGGGGTFANVWSPNTFASAGFYISDTSTPGHIYEVSVEHHVRNEFVLDNVQNWEFLAPQTEQEVGDGPDAVSLEVRNSRNILFANYHGYRVTRSYHPAETAVKLFNSSDIRFRNVHINAESGVALCDEIGCGTYLRASKFPFENAIQDKTRKLEVREREFAVLDVTGPARAGRSGRDGKVKQAGDRLLVDLRRDRRRGRRALFRREALPADLSLDPGQGPGGGARPFAGPDEPGGRPFGQAAGGVVVRPAGQRLFDRSQRAQGPDDGDRADGRRPRARREDPAAGQLVEQRRVQGSVRSGHRPVHHPGRDVRPRRRRAQGAGIRVARRQPVAAGLPGVAAGTARTMSAGAGPTACRPTA
jgi:hypothetical protein